MDKLELGGNAMLLKLGTKLTKLGAKYTNKGNKLVVTNPSCKLHSPHLLVINFTVNNTDKYQLTLQGNYKEKYKETGKEDNPISSGEMFILIKEHNKEWFLKD